MIEPTQPLLPDYFELHAKWRANKVALISEEETLTWSAFFKRTCQVANGLNRAGLLPQDRAIVFMSNSGMMAEVLFGLMVGGYVSAPLNVTVSDEAIVNMIKDCGAKAIIASKEHIERLSSICKALGSSAPTLRICTDPNYEGWTDYKSWRDQHSSKRPDNQIKPDHLLNLIYSSGTTGQPKGIAHTHQGRRDWAYDLANALRYNSSARFMATIGLYSNITWVGMLSALLSGGTLIVSSKFDEEKIWRDIQDLKVTHLAMVPIMYERMMDVVGHQGFDVRSVQGLMSAGSPLRPAIREKLFKRFPCGITELYGLTEGVITTLDPEEAEGRMSSVGLPILGTDLKILNHEDEECPPETSGEIVMSTRFMMPGYFGRDDITQESLFVDEKGQHWLRTGDIGYLDMEGYLYIVDRKKDMILSGGQNIYPQDIEAVISRHEDVADVAVIGVKSKKWGETPLAVITPRNGSANADELLKWTNGKVGKQQRIAGVEFLPEIPRNPNGKILKRKLRETFGDISFE